MEKEVQLGLAGETPYFGHLGIEIVKLEKGYARLRLDFKDYLTHPYGYIHGGAIASLADSAGVNSVMTVLDEGQKAFTLEMKVNYLLPVKDGPLFGDGRMIHKGKQFAVSDVDVKNADGQLVAKAIVTCVIQSR